ncbi:MAG TPA: tRNA (guanosine(46)-N7)-methyltransferase TrmB [Epsilonproteobacteria bacterium]|nr:tRNA (guanosine(46)-N7)-methyltransferase TrmB [Campylobacterota bacterium]
MPHIKVTPISKETLEARAKKEPVPIEFVAHAINYDEILLGINYQDERFLLLYRYSQTEAMLKFEKITRPLKLSLLKEAIDLVAKVLEFEILSSNILSTRRKPPLFASEYYKKIEDFIDVEFDFDSVAIEVGFGSGRHILYQANANPKTLYIGIEIHTPSAGQLLKQIEIQNLKNIWVVNYDARLFLEMLPSNTVKQIFVHFPVPWDKKPSRRVIGVDFVNEAMRVLKVGGTLELRTDSDKYYMYALEVFSSLKKAKIGIQKNHALPIISKYEARWQRQSKDIYDVTLVCDELSPVDEKNYNFSFGKIRYNDDIEKILPKETKVCDGYFVHFERIYRISQSEIFIKCSLGNFSRPEHKYLFLGDEESFYYPSNPIASRANYQAHQQIKEILDGKCHSCR